MMEWEKPYMEASIDTLQPTGDVLEIGFGLGYSATQIMKHITLKVILLIECNSISNKQGEGMGKKLSKYIYYYC